MLIKRTAIFGFLILAAWGICVTSWAQVSSSPSAAPTSLKNIKIICLGYLQGEPKDIDHFKDELEKQLDFADFFVTDNKSKCDATLVGELKVTHDLFMANKKAASVQVKLLDSGYKVVWHDTFKFRARPNAGFWYAYAPPHGRDSIKNRAVDIALSLAYAKKQAK